MIGGCYLNSTVQITLKCLLFGHFGCQRNFIFGEYCVLIHEARGLLVIAADIYQRIRNCKIYTVLENFQTH